MTRSAHDPPLYSRAAAVGKYLQRWAYALTLIDKDIGGLLTPAPVDLKNGVCLPNILMRSDDGLGKALTRANSGWISNSAVAGKAFLSFEINMQSRFAAQAKLVKKGSLAYEFAARGEELKKASKSPDVVCTEEGCRQVGFVHHAVLSSNFMSRIRWDCWSRSAWPLTERK